jgi:hypothetical protein
MERNTKRLGTFAGTEGKEEHMKRIAKRMAADALRTSKGDASFHVGISAYNYGVGDDKIPKLVEEMRKLPELSGVELHHDGFMGFVNFIRHPKVEAK